MKPIFITSVFWKDKRLHFTEPETDEIKARRNRGLDVSRTYEYKFTDNGVIFFPDSDRSLTVALEEARCGCTCRDLKNRRMPCKHIFGAARLLGDTEATLEIATAISRTSPSPSAGRKKSRFQDTKVGRYFTLLDFLVSDTAIKRGIPNWVDITTDEGKNAIAMMQLLCANLLDPLCDEFNRISITRGYLGRELYKQLYRAENWPKGALAHGFSKSAGADILVHSWGEDALKLAFHIQASPQYIFDFIRTYPGSSILCVGVDPFQHKRIIQEWLPGFRGCKIHKPSGSFRQGQLGQDNLL